MVKEYSYRNYVQGTSVGGWLAYSLLHLNNFSSTPLTVDIVQVVWPTAKKRRYYRVDTNNKQCVLNIDIENNKLINIILLRLNKISIQYNN